MVNVIIADHNQQFCESLYAVLNDKGHQVTTLNSLKEIFRETRNGQYDVILLSNYIQDINCIELIPKIIGTPAKPEVIVMADQGDPDEAEDVIRNGGWDYLEKNKAKSGILTSLEVIEKFRHKFNPRKNTIPIENLRREGLVGNDPKLLNCLETVVKAAGSTTNVLINGETGTGKELFASAIHRHSSRASNNFVVVDCAALPGNLVESTLFGHERGAFTGAEKEHPGLIRQADGGTLFLDEIGELPLSMQKIFLRVLEEKRFRPVGAKKEMNSDFRLVAATNRDLEVMAQKGEFRKDLLFRLRGFNINLPPLRERKSDIKELVSFYLSKLGINRNEPLKSCGQDFIKALQRYDWPGNVRELIHSVDRANAASDGYPILVSKHLPTYIRVTLARSSMHTKTGRKENDNEVDSAWSLTEDLPPIQQVREEALEQTERNYLWNLGRQCEGDIGQACSVSGLSRSRLYALLKKYELSLSS